jgi:hypothetical protein
VKQEIKTVKSHLVFKQNNIPGREMEGDRRGNKAGWGEGGNTEEISRSKKIVTKLWQRLNHSIAFRHDSLKLELPRV